MKFRLKALLTIAYVSALALVAVACGKEDRELGDGEYYYYPSSETETESAGTETDETAVCPYYLILSNDTAEEVIQLYNYDNGMRYQYHYSMDTQFKNKYGGDSTAADFTPGRAVWLGDLDDNGRLKELGISDQVWEYADITRFEANPEEGQLEIADSLYSYGDEAFTFEGDNIVGLDALTENDVLYVVGVGKHILSVNVTTGHGQIELTNTDLFEGSFLQLSNKIFVKITENMKMDLQEGTYELSVANNGWGGTTQVTITRGQTTTVDLDQLKGSGPKYGQITFQFGFTGAEVSLDGKTFDASKAQTLKYGSHILKIVTSDGDVWTKILYVNSAKATIIIDSDDLTTTVDVTQSTESSSQSSTNNSGTTSTIQSNSSENSSSSSSSSSSETLTDYLSTLSSIFD